MKEYMLPRKHLELLSFFQFLTFMANMVGATVLIEGVRSRHF